MLRWFLAWVIAGTGCMPFAVPPARLSLGGGPVTGAVPYGASELPLDVGATFRAGFHPLDLAEGSSERAFDVGAGYVLDWLSTDMPNSPNAPPEDDHTYAQGPYLQGAYSPLRHRLGDTYLRVGGRADIDLLFLPNQPETGFGGSAVLELELSHDVSGPFASSQDDEPGFAAGVQHGRWALGVFAGGTLRQFDDQGYGGLTAGLSVRIPLLVGIACCAWGSDDDDDAEPPRKRAEPRRRLQRKPAEPRPARPTASP